MATIEHLLVETFGAFIGKHSERLFVSKGKETLVQAPLMHLRYVTIASPGVSISADAIKECCERGIPMYFIDKNDHFATLFSPGLVGTVKTRRAQFAAYHDGRGTQIGLCIAAAKINNQVATLKYIAKSRKESQPEVYQILHEAAIEALGYADRLSTLADQNLDDVCNSLMAFEANAASQYWGALRAVVPEDYSWTKRIGRGAIDPVNSLLNYGYAMLRGRVEQAITNAGMDSYAGFIHADRPGKHSLTFDMMEEFRSVAVDRLVVGLVNRKYLVPITDHGQLEDGVKKDYSNKVTEHLKATVRYEGARFTIEYIIQNQARRLAAYLRSDAVAYQPYKAEW
ncbi:MAG: CRISPR-associated endonuclease Cas1 [Chloroflexota bacterium]